MEKQKTEEVETMLFHPYGSKEYDKLKKLTEEKKKKLNLY